MVEPSEQTSRDPLRQRVEAELALQNLVLCITGRAVALPRRASGMVALLARRLDSVTAVCAAVDGDAEALRQLTQPRRFDVLPPALVHHLALFHAAIAEVLDADPGRQIVASDAYVASLAAWLALEQERRYLDRVAGQVLGEGTSTPPLQPGAMARATIDELAEAARAEAEARSAAAPAFMALGQVKQACHRAGYLDTEARTWTDHAERAVEALIERAARPHLEALARSADREEPDDTGPLAMLELVALWRWSDKHASLEILVLDELLPIAWEHYQRGHDQALDELLTTSLPLTRRLTDRIKSDPTKLGYASRAADVLVFRAEVARASRDRRRLLERAVGICPSHSNARKMLASMLCLHVIEAPQGADPAELRAELERAEALYPRAKLLEQARRRLAQGRLW